MQMNEMEMKGSNRCAETIKDDVKGQDERQKEFLYPGGVKRS